jgi:hypothetical protein
MPGRSFPTDNARLHPPFFLCRLRRRLVDLPNVRPRTTLLPRHLRTRCSQPSLREAGRRYQRTPRGRSMSAERSRRYRDRRRVTDQCSPPLPVCDVVSASATETHSETPIRPSPAQPCDPAEEKTAGHAGATGRFGADMVRCSFCRCWRQPWIRHAPFRRRSSSRKFGKVRSP